MGGVGWGGRRAQRWRVGLEGIESKCDQGTLYGIPKYLITILCWGKMGV